MTDTQTRSRSQDVRMFVTDLMRTMLKHSVHMGYDSYYKDSFFEVEGEVVFASEIMGYFQDYDKANKKGK